MHKEIWDAYLPDGILAGCDLVRGEPIPDGLYHLVSEILVRHTDGDYLLMQRDHRKPNYGGYFEATAGGSALKGENALSCAMRELREETGIDAGTFTNIGRFISHDTIYETFLCVTDCDKNSVTLQEGETVSCKWINEGEFIGFVNSQAMIDVQFQRYRPYLEQMGYLMIPGEQPSPQPENPDMEMARRVARVVAARGGSAWFVGGYVRDRISGRDCTDLDIEVHGIAPEELARILDNLGQRISIGESFGIFNLKGYGLDIAMPRKETARGMGHRDFDIFVDPFIGTRGACLRRDFTVNAMLCHVLTGEIVDHFGGREDLESGILRHVNDASFAEDPLRVLRGAQFAARFGLKCAPETVSLCKTMDLSTLARERVEGEMEKALVKAPRPSVFFEVLRQMDQLDIWFPELKALIGVEQNPYYHAEGDVWNHTMLVLDRAAAFRHRTARPLWFMLAALCHDFGKAVTTASQDGTLHAYGHEQQGIPLAEAFLLRLTNQPRLVEYVKNMVLLHMKPNTMAHACSAVKNTNKLFDQSAAPEELVYLALADDRGRISQANSPSTEDFLRERLAVYRTLMDTPRVMGRDLLDARLRPGPDFSQILDHARKLHLAGVEKDSALKQTLAFARQLRRKS